MRYGHKSISSEAKVTSLEWLLARSNPIADAICLSSLQSKAELRVLADVGREILKDVAAEDEPQILQGPYQSVPIIGQTPIEKAAEAVKKLDGFLVSQHEAELEMNLAAMYVALMYTKGIPLTQRTTVLMDRANRKIYTNNVYGGMVYYQRAGTILYMNAAFHVLGGHAQKSDDNPQLLLQQARKLLIEAKDTAQGYNPFNQTLATFNLGRLEFFQGENKALTREYLQHAYALARGGNEMLERLAGHYLAALEDKTRFGTIIEDPEEHQEMLLKMVGRALSLSAEEQSSIVSL